MMSITKEYHPHSASNKEDFASVTRQLKWRKIGGGYSMFLPMYYSFCHYRHQESIGVTRFFLSGIRTLVKAVVFGLKNGSELQSEGEEPDTLIIPPYRTDPENLINSDYYGAYIRKELNGTYVFIKPRIEKARLSIVGGFRLARVWILWFREVESLIKSSDSKELDVCRGGIVDCFQQLVQAFIAIDSGADRLPNPLRTIDCASIYSFPWKISLIELGVNFMQLEYVNGLIYPEHYHYWFDYNPDSTLIPDVLLVDNPHWSNQLVGSRYVIHTYNNYLRYNDLFLSSAPVLFASTGINENRLREELELLEGYTFNSSLVFKPHPGFGYSKRAIEMIRSRGLEIEMESLYSTTRKYSALVSNSSSLLYERQYHNLPVFRMPTAMNENVAGSWLLKSVPLVGPELAKKRRS